MTEKRFNFDSTLIRALEPKPGVFELVDKDEVTVYIGGADNLLTCLEELLTNSNATHITQRVTQRAEKYRFEYRVDYMGELLARRRILLDGCHRDSFGGY